MQQGIKGENVDNSDNTNDGNYGIGDDDGDSDELLPLQLRPRTRGIME